MRTPPIPLPEEGAREGSFNPSPHVHGAVALALLTADSDPARPDDPVELRLLVTPSLPPAPPPLGGSADRFRPHDPLRCSNGTRNVILPDGRALPRCLNGGFHIYTHDGVAAGLASAAPSRRPDDWPGGARYAATVSHATISQQLVSLAPGRARWKTPDVAAPDDTFLDVTICQSASRSHLRGGGDGCSIVLSALAKVEADELDHYKAELSATGPFAPGYGRLVP